jgi:argininosuccinate lyase
MHEFNQSLKYDRSMHAADVHGSTAYAKALTRVGILTSEEGKVVAGLTAVGKEWEDVQLRTIFSRYLWYQRHIQFGHHPDDEDIHTANERRLSELIGPLGGTLAAPATTRSQRTCVSGCSALLARSRPRSRASST